MNTFSHVPPGFRFHPTEEELVDYYLRKKLASRKIDLNVIKDVDLYKIEAWDLEEYCRIGAKDQNEWYFFSHKDKKYPSGTRTNRATIKGFWKATGRDKPIYSKHSLIGMRKTLVYYKGRAPNGQKSDWIMHEYRLESNECGTPQEEGWVVCKAFKKQAPTVRKGSDHEFPYSYNEGICVPDLGSPNEIIIEPPDTVYQLLPHDSSRLPQLESPKLPDYIIHGNFPHSSIISPDEQLKYHCHYQMISMVDQVTDWRILDKFVASQLSQGEISTDLNYSNAPIKQGEAVEFASTSSPSHQIQLQE